MELNASTLSVVHHGTLETKRVSSGSWLLFFEDGVGALVDEDTGQILYVDDLLRRQLCISDG
eukprot:7716508-Prorocentrum_lima.AAC.1